MTAHDCSTSLRSLGAALALAVVVTAPSVAQDATCRPVGRRSAPAVEQIARSVDVLGLMTVEDKIRTTEVTDVVSMDYQSDRPYPPYLHSTSGGRVQFGWRTGQQSMAAGGGRFAVISDSIRRAVVSPRGSQLVPAQSYNLVDSRALDPWAVLADWRGRNDLRLVSECRYRDFWRTVVARGVGVREQRLYLDIKSGFPVKLERREEHMLWGDVLAEYLWSIWTPAGEGRALVPRYAFRLVDGEVNHERMAASSSLVPDTSGLRIPSNVGQLMNLPADVPDTIRVGPSTFLLRTTSYTNVVTLQRDTVWVLDAQIGEERARLDSVWIGRLFPGRHPVMLVVTDLAHPHIAGMRFWVSAGATIVSHPNSGAFLRRVSQRRWTLKPDRLAKNARAPFRFLPVSHDTAFAQGGIRVVPIDGIGSEGALMVYLEKDRFLYAGDFVQSGGPGSFSSVYANEVLAAMRKAALAPQRFAAMHVSLSPIERLRQQAGVP